MCLRARWLLVGRVARAVGKPAARRHACPCCSRCRRLLRKHACVAHALPLLRAHPCIAHVLPLLSAAGTPMYCPRRCPCCLHTHALRYAGLAPSCPADGFGAEGRGAEVPPNATLEIELTLLGWHKVEKVTGGSSAFCSLLPLTGKQHVDFKAALLPGVE